MFERIDQLLLESGYTDTELAKIAGVGKSTVSGWRKGVYNPKEDKLKKIADYFGVSVEWLTGVDHYRTKSQQTTMDILFESKAQRSHCKELFEVAAGNGRINSDYPSEYESGIDYKTGEYVDVVVRGNSMYPIIFDGDVVTIHLHTVSDPSPKDLTVVKVDSESTTIKYVELASNGIWIKAENKEVFEDRFYSIQDVMNLPIKILGTAVAIKRKL